MDLQVFQIADENLFPGRTFSMSVDSFAVSPGNVFFGPAKVCEDCYFVLGDNRDHSMDSRVLGMIPCKNLIGKASPMVWFSNDPSKGWFESGKVRGSRIGSFVN